MTSNKFRTWMNRTFQQTHPFLLPIDHDNSMLYCDAQTMILLPSLNHPHALAAKRAALTQNESDDLTIAIIRTHWPKVDNSNVGDLYKIYSSKNSR